MYNACALRDTPMHLAKGVRVTALAVIALSLLMAGCRGNRLSRGGQDPAAPPPVVPPPATPVATTEPELGLEQIKQAGDMYDLDKDGLVANRDNCPWAPNPDQADVDQDGHGDACDPGDNVLPTVTLLAPTTSPIRAGSNAGIRAVAHDPDGQIVAIRLFANDNVLEEVSGPTLEYTWERIPPGQYTLFAVATDNDNGDAESRRVTIRVIPP
jgi:hypothetical protein